MLYKIEKEDLFKQEIDDIMHLSLFDVAEKKEMINIPVNEPSKEDITEDELDEFLKEFVSHDEAPLEKLESEKYFLQINENTKIENNNDIEIPKIHENLKENLNNEKSNKAIENCKENKNIDNLDLEFFYLIEKECNNQDEEELQTRPTFRNSDVENENQTFEPGKDEINKAINQNAMSKKFPQDQKKEKSERSKKERKNEKISSININNSLKNKESEIKIQNEIINDKNIHKSQLNKNNETLKVSKNIESSKSTNSKKNIKKENKEHGIIKCENHENISIKKKIIEKNSKKISIDKLEDETKTIEKDPKKCMINKKIKYENAEILSNKTEKYHKSPNSEKLKKPENEIIPENDSLNDHFILRKQNNNDNDNLEEFFGTPKFDHGLMAEKELKKGKDMNNKLGLLSENQNKHSYQHDNFEDSLSEELYGTPIRQIKKEEKEVRHVILEEKNEIIKEITNKPVEIKEKLNSSMEIEFKIKKRKEIKEDLHNIVQNGNNEYGSKVSSVSNRRTEGTFRVT